MTPRERVLKVLNGGHTDKVPFTVYEAKIPQCSAERELRNRGMAILNRRQSVFKIHRPNVRETSYTYVENGKQLVRTTFETPVGSLTTLREPVGFTSWAHEKLFKSKEDYKALHFFYKDEQIAPAYEGFAAAEKSMGDDIVLRTGIGSEPLQNLVSGAMAMETFCLEWMDNRDEILKIYDVLVERQRKLYPIVAQSPATHANYGGNVVPAIVSPKDFEEYYLPHYNEAAEVMHKHGKKLGSHFDDDMTPLVDQVAKTELDYIEALTNTPDTDLSLAAARKAWPDKVLWLNFPSSVHLKSNEEVKAKTVDMLNELSSVDGIIMGITEDVPQNRWRESFLAIMDGLDRHAREKPELYD